LDIAKYYEHEGDKLKVFIFKGQACLHGDQNTCNEDIDPEGAKLYQDYAAKRQEEEKDKLNQIKNEQNKKQKEIEKLNQSINEIDQRVVEIDDEIAHKSKYIEKIDREIAALENQNSEYLAALNELRMKDDMLEEEETYLIEERKKIEKEIELLLIEREQKK